MLEPATQLLQLVSELPSSPGTNPPPARPPSPSDRPGGRRPWGDWPIHSRIRLWRLPLHHFWPPLPRLVSSGSLVPACFPGAHQPPSQGAWPGLRGCPSGHSSACFASGWPGAPRSPAPVARPRITEKVLHRHVVASQPRRADAEGRRDIRSCRLGHV